MLLDIGLQFYTVPGLRNFVFKFLVKVFVSLYLLTLLARLHEVHEVHRAIVTSVVRVYVYVCVRVRRPPSASHFRLKFLKLLYLDSH